MGRKTRRKDYCPGGDLAILLGFIPRENFSMLWQNEPSCNDLEEMELYAIVQNSAFILANYFTKKGIILPEESSRREIVDNFGEHIDSCSDCFLDYYRTIRDFARAEVVGTSKRKILRKMASIDDKYLGLL